jgi:hypothetical protein
MRPNGKTAVRRWRRTAIKPHPPFREPKVYYGSWLCKKGANASSFSKPMIDCTLAWISTEPDLPNMALGQTAHFRVLSLRNYCAKRCSDSPISQRLLAQPPHDSGQFRGLLDEEMLGAGRYQRTNWPTATAKFPSLVNRLAFWMLGNSPSVEIQARRIFLGLQSARPL